MKRGTKTFLFRFCFDFRFPRNETMVRISLLYNWWIHQRCCCSLRRYGITFDDNIDAWYIHELHFLSPKNLPRKKTNQNMNSSSSKICHPWPLLPYLFDLPNYSPRPTAEDQQYFLLAAIQDFLMEQVLVLIRPKSCSYIKCLNLMK